MNADAAADLAHARRVILAAAVLVGLALAAVGIGALLLALGMG